MPQTECPVDCQWIKDFQGKVCYQYTPGGWLISFVYQRYLIDIALVYRPVWTDWNVSLSLGMLMRSGCHYIYNRWIVASCDKAWINRKMESSYLYALHSKCVNCTLKSFDGHYNLRAWVSDRQIAHTVWIILYYNPEWKLYFAWFRIKRPATW